MKAIGLAVAALSLTAAASHRLCAQNITVGVQGVFGDYREVSSDLHFQGSGGGVAASFALKKLGLDVSYVSLEYKPADDGTATRTFKAKQLDVRARYYVAGPVSVELGVTSRETDPEFEAQSFRALRGGVRASYLLGPGVRMGLRAGMLFGSKFSGGGTTSPIGALELGLGLGVDALKGKVRISGDYDFQRVARTTSTGSGEVDVPIQQALGRVGIAVAF